MAANAVVIFFTITFNKHLDNNNKKQHQFITDIRVGDIYLSSIAKQLLAQLILFSLQSDSWNQPILESYGKYMVVIRVGLEHMISRLGGRHLNLGGGGGWGQRCLKITYHPIFRKDIDKAKYEKCLFMQLH
jgi:hypothetical protein